MKPPKNNWIKVCKETPPPKGERVLLWTGSNQYIGQWVQNPLTGDDAFSISDLENGERLIVKATHWDWLGRPPETESE
jgi:hypothetical protein